MQTSKLMYFVTLTMILFISCNTSTDPIPDESRGNDYFPLSIGNKWEYRFIYYPEACYSYGNWREGLIKWELTEKYIEKSFVRYIIEETVNGIDVFHRLDNTGIDTTYYDNLKTEIEVIENSDGNIVHKGGFIYKHLKFSRYYQDTTIVILNYNYWPINDRETYSLENLSDELGHRLTLEPNIGIKKWQIANNGNCSPKGSLTLINYEIIE